MTLGFGSLVFLSLYTMYCLTIRILPSGAEINMSMWSTLTLMKESFPRDQTPGLSRIIIFQILIQIFSLVELIKEVEDGGSSSFGLLVTFYLSRWKVFVILDFVNLITTIVESLESSKIDNAGFSKFVTLNLGGQ